MADYGHLVVDECHHLSAHSFEQVARQAKARFVLGLSATVARKDGHHPIIFMQCGPVRHRVIARSQAAARPFEHYVLVQPTSFRSHRPPDPDRRLEFQALYQELVEDEQRNRRICGDVVESVRNGRSPLVLTERNDHLDRLERGLAGEIRHLIVLRAGLGRGYEAVGYTVLLPASAIPGWPADVVLPSDPVWKRDYSGSVRRLVRDGVDTPLARLFAHVARTVLPDAAGASRARSATEAFLFRRLETLPETKGRFTVNARLPIPFDGMATLEVDLLCPDARVAVELDGSQHLADPIAYRRDRRKDQLLQEGGYLVLRFLAEDVGKELDLVLDAILRSLINRASREGSTRALFARDHLASDLLLAALSRHQ